MTSTEGRVESIACEVVLFFARFFPWRGNYWIVGYSVVLWPPEGAVLSLAPHT